jgi:hypothetical protein
MHEPKEIEFRYTTKKECIVLVVVEITGLFLWPIYIAFHNLTKY